VKHSAIAGESDLYDWYKSVSLMRNVGDDAGDFAIDSLAHCVCVCDCSQCERPRKERRQKLMRKFLQTITVTHHSEHMKWKAADIG
ncbi:MAG: hypothetical protein QWI73_06740, partial [Alphaproteobacteria bacterium]|nr:hypothetical protein [Alphaproteobacteria bacterium]